MLIIAKDYKFISLPNKGYIAGSGEGIVTVLGKPASREIFLLNAKTMIVEDTHYSLSNGHYMIMNLDVNKEYLVMVRDYKREFEPFAWDYVKPASDLTLIEQQTLWASFQN